MPPFSISKGETMKKIIIGTSLLLASCAIAIGGYVIITRASEMIEEVRKEYIDREILSTIESVRFTTDNKKQRAVSDATRDELLRLIYAQHLKVNDLQSRVDMVTQTLTETNPWVE